MYLPLKQFKLGWGVPHHRLSPQQRDRGIKKRNKWVLMTLGVWVPNKRGLAPRLRKRLCFTPSVLFSAVSHQIPSAGLAWTEALEGRLGAQGAHSGNHWLGNTELRRPGFLIVDFVLDTAIRSSESL